MRTDQVFLPPDGLAGLLARPPGCAAGSQGLAWLGQAGVLLRIRGRVVLIGAIRACSPGIALLRVKGRDAERAVNRIPGHFTPDEVIGRCRAADAPALTPHHFGRFAFNTADPAEVDAAVRGARHLERVAC